MVHWPHLNHAKKKKKNPFGFWTPACLYVPYFHISFHPEGGKIDQILTNIQWIPERLRVDKDLSRKESPSFKRILSTIVSHPSFPYLIQAASCTTLKATIFRLSVPAHARRLCLLHHPNVPSLIHSNSRIAIYFKISIVFPSYITPLCRPKE